MVKKRKKTKRRSKKMGKNTKLKQPKNPPKDEIGRISGGCPWCNYDNNDPSKGPTHKKVDNTVVNSGTSRQCLTCGKDWQQNDLHKKWSEALERGEGWKREMTARGLVEA